MRRQFFRLHLSTRNPIPCANPKTLPLAFLALRRQLGGARLRDCCGGGRAQDSLFCRRPPVPLLPSFQRDSTPGPLKLHASDVCLFASIVAGSRFGPLYLCGSAPLPTKWPHGSGLVPVAPPRPLARAGYCFRRSCLPACRLALLPLHTAPVCLLADPCERHQRTGRGELRRDRAAACSR